MSATQAKALAKQAAADAKLAQVHQAAMQLLIDLSLPTAALSHPALVRLYEAICTALDQPTSKMASCLMSPQQVENHAYYKERVDNTASTTEPTPTVVPAIEGIEVVQHASVEEVIDENPLKRTLDEANHSVNSSSSSNRPKSPEKPAKRPCNVTTTIDNVIDQLDDDDDEDEPPPPQRPTVDDDGGGGGDDLSERDYVEQFLRASVEDFLPEKPPSGQNQSDTTTSSGDKSGDINQVDPAATLIDPEKMKEKTTEMAQTLHKLHRENEAMKRNQAGFNEKYVNVAKRFYQVEEKLRRRECEREKNDQRLRMTLEKLEQAQKALENTCRQNEKMMEQLERQRQEQSSPDVKIKESLRKFFRVDAEIQAMRKHQLVNLFADFEMRDELNGAGVETKMRSEQFERVMRCAKCDGSYAPEGECERVVLTTCGHTMCRQCAMEKCGENGTMTCPLCPNHASTQYRREHVLKLII